MTNNNNDASEVRAVSSDLDCVGTTVAGDVASSEGGGAAPTVAKIAEAVASFEIIDFDVFVDAEEVVGATVATTIKEFVVRG